MVQADKSAATDVLTSISNGLLTVDCPGLAIEVLDEAMECAIESGLNDRMEMLAELLLLANTAIQQPRRRNLRRFETIARWTERH